MNFKKLLALLLALAMLVCCFAACGSDDEEEKDEDEKVEENADDEKDEGEDDEDADEDDKDEDADKDDKEDEDKDADDEKDDDDDKTVSVTDADLEGIWELELDLGPALSEEMAIDAEGTLMYDFEWVFTEDELTVTIVGTPEAEDAYEFMDSIYSSDYFTEEDIDDMLLLYEFESYEELVMYMAEEVASMLPSDEPIIEGEYVVEDNVIQFEDGSEIEFEIDGREMTVTVIYDDEDNFYPFDGATLTKK